MLRDGLVHVIATDAHGVNARRPQIRRAFEFAIGIVGEAVACELCCHNPRRIFDGQAVEYRRVEYQPDETIRKIYAIPELDNFLGDRLREGR